MPGAPNTSTNGAQQPTPIQRAVMNRQSQVRRSTSGSQGSRILRPQSHASSNHSPRLQPTPPHTISPSTAKSPSGLPKGGMISPSVDLKAQQQPQQRQPLEPRGYQQQQPPSRLSISTAGPPPPLHNVTPSSADGSRSGEMNSSNGGHNSLYPSAFQAHIEQLGKLSCSFLFLLVQWNFVVLG